MVQEHPCASSAAHSQHQTYFDVGVAHLPPARATHLPAWKAHRATRFQLLRHQQEAVLCKLLQHCQAGKPHAGEEAVREPGCVVQHVPQRAWSCCKAHTQPPGQHVLAASVHVLDVAHWLAVALHQQVGLLLHCARDLEALQGCMYTEVDATRQVDVIASTRQCRSGRQSRHALRNAPPTSPAPAPQV